MTQVILRRATAADAAAIAEVRIKSWRATYRGMIPDAYLDEMQLEDSTAHWTRILEVASDKVCVFVAESEDGVVGFASGMLLQEEKFGLNAELTAVYLNPDMQRSGIGRRMVQEVAQALQAKGAKGLLVWVISGNKPARKFYEHLGAELLIEQSFNWDGMDLQEVGYGWKDLGALTPDTARIRKDLH